MMHWYDVVSAPGLFLLADGDPDAGASWLETVHRGGVIAYIIIFLSMCAVALLVMHFIQIRRGALMPAHQSETIEVLLARQDVPGALEYCMRPENDSYLTRILAAGLSRLQRSAFGVLEVRGVIEEAGEDQTARLYRSTDALSVIGGIAPLLGLLGTVLGMVGAFESLSRSAGSNHEELAANISLALVTTLMGLILAIPCIALFTYFRNRIDAIASETGAEIDRLLLLLETPQNGSPGRATGRNVAAARAGGAG